MVRGKPLDSVLKSKIISLHKKKIMYKEISAEMDIPRSTIHSVIKKYEDARRNSRKLGFGTRRKTTLEEDNSLQEIVKNHPYASVREIKRHWENQMKVPVSIATCRRRLQILGIQVPVRYFPNYYDRTKKYDPQEPEVNILFDNGDPNYSNENGDGMSMQQMDYYPEESQQYPEITSNQQHHNQQCNISESAQSSQKPKKFKIKKKKGNTTLAATLNSLQTVTKAISSTQDEFNLFGEYMAMSLRTMPLRNALRCKEKLLSIIVNERLNMNTVND